MFHHPAPFQASSYKFYQSFVLRSSGISRKLAVLIMRYSQKKKWISIVSYIVLRILQLLITSEPPNEHFNQIENWKCHMCNFRLILLDSITFIYPQHTRENSYIKYLSLLYLYVNVFISFLLQTHYLNIICILLFAISNIYNKQMHYNMAVSYPGVILPSCLMWSVF